MAIYIQYIHSQTKTPLTATPERWYELKELKNIHGENLYIFVQEIVKEEPKQVAQARSLSNQPPKAKNNCRTCNR